MGSGGGPAAALEGAERAARDVKASGFSYSSLTGDGYKPSPTWFDPRECLGCGPLTCREPVGFSFSGFRRVFLVFFGGLVFFRFFFGFLIFFFFYFFFLTNVKVDQNLKLSKFSNSNKFQSKQNFNLSKFRI
jgi:hypothetical protein